MAGVEVAARPAPSVVLPVAEVPPMRRTVQSRFGPARFFASLRMTNLAPTIAAMMAKTTSRG